MCVISNKETDGSGARWSEEESVKERGRKTSGRKVEYCWATDSHQMSEWDEGNQKENRDSSKKNIKLRDNRGGKVQLQGG